MITAAFVTSLFFLGFNLEVLSLAFAFLWVWVFFVAWRWYRQGIAIPRTRLAIVLAVYTGWLALTTWWSPIVAVSNITFWWMAIWPLVFWTFILDPARERIWEQATLLLTAAALALVVVGFYQRVVYHETPIGPFLDHNLYAALLSLFVLPIGGRFLWERRRQASVVLASLFFLMTLAIALTKSRGVALAFGVALASLALMTYRLVGMKRLVCLLSLAVIAYVLANIAWDGGVLERMATLEAPSAAGRGRFIIWEGSWRLLMDHNPWFGVGLGVYPFLWPPYQRLEDAGGGFFAHNDYLQMWIDAGLPGLLLLLAIVVLTTRMLMKLRRQTIDRGVQIEGAGLGAALLALAVNCVFTYNFYVVPTMIVSALILARLHTLAERPRERRIFRPSKRLRPLLYRALLLTLWLGPAFALGSVATAMLLGNQGIAQARSGDYLAADTSFAKASVWWPESDIILATRADTYRLSLAQMPPENVASRRALFDAALSLLDEARRHNRFRPEIFLVRAELYRLGADLVGTDWQRYVEENYADTLRLNPMYYDARVAYARHLVSQQREMQARAVLEAGIAYAYIDTERIAPYLALTADLRWRAGDTAGAEALRQRLRRIAEDQPLRRWEKGGNESTPALGGLLKSSVDMR